MEKFNGNENGTERHKKGAFCLARSAISLTNDELLNKTTPNKVHIH